jgi:hypothetical protein
MKTLPVVIAALCAIVTPASGAEVSCENKLGYGSYYSEHVNQRTNQTFACYIDIRGTARQISGQGVRFWGQFRCPGWNLPNSSIEGWMRGSVFHMVRSWDGAPRQSWDGRCSDQAIVGRAYNFGTEDHDTATFSIFY